MPRQGCVLLLQHIDCPVTPSRRRRRRARAQGVGVGRATPAYSHQLDRGRGGDLHAGCMAQCPRQTTGRAVASTAPSRRSTTARWNQCHVRRGWDGVAARRAVAAAIRRQGRCCGYRLVRTNATFISQCPKGQTVTDCITCTRSRQCPKSEDEPMAHQRRGECAGCTCGANSRVVTRGRWACSALASGPLLLAPAARALVHVHHQLPCSCVRPCGARMCVAPTRAKSQSWSVTEQSIRVTVRVPVRVPQGRVIGAAETHGRRPRTCN